MKKPAPVEESSSQNLFFKVKSNYQELKSRSISTDIGLGIIIIFLITASLVPQLSKKLGLLSSTKEKQKTFAQGPSEASRGPRGAASRAQPVDFQTAPKIPDIPAQKQTTPATAGADLSGKVINAASKEPIPDVLVVVESSDFKTKATTDNLGRYQILDIPAGKYAVEVQTSGFGAQKKPVLLPSGQTVTSDFDLAK